MTSNDEKMVWCEHCVETSSGYECLIIGIISLRTGKMRFCPVCGTPKPAEKELAEKLFAVHGWASWKDISEDMKSDWRKVASVAEEHFKGKP